MRTIYIQSCEFFGLLGASFEKKCLNESHQDSLCFIKIKPTE